MYRQQAVIMILTISFLQVAFGDVEVAYNSDTYPKVIMEYSEEYGLLHGINTWTKNNTFDLLTLFPGGINIGFTSIATEGNMRYVSNNFQGYNGSDWVVLSGGGGGADTTCNDVVCDLGDDTGYDYVDLDFTGTTGLSDNIDDDTIYDIVNVSLLMEYRVNMSTEVCANGNYSYGYYINGTPKCRSDAQGSATGSYPIKLNLTTVAYSLNLKYGGYKGYASGNYLCDNEYSDSHVCTEFEVVSFFANENNNPNLHNTDFWVITGGPKYIPATVPVNDCNGFKYNGTTSYLGNYYHYNTTDGGDSRALNCQTKLKLGCCTY